MIYLQTYEKKHYPPQLFQTEKMKEPCTYLDLFSCFSLCFQKSFVYLQ